MGEMACLISRICVRVGGLSVRTDPTEGSCGSELSFAFKPPLPGDSLVALTEHSWHGGVMAGEGEMVTR